MKTHHPVGSSIVARVAAGILAFGLAGAVQAQEAGYEGGRGLITLEGPSGMFINPTSATLPEKAYTGQLCVFFPNNKTDVVGTGFLAGYGVSDDLELGATGNYINIDGADDLSGGGPFVRYRFMKDDGTVPQLSAGAYSRFGDQELRKYGVFLAAYKRVPIANDGFVRSVGFHAGVRQMWFDDDVSPEDSSLVGYGGAELQLPLRIYAVGEVSTKDSGLQNDVPYAFGLQWRAPGIAMSVAGIQDGNLDDPSFYYGIGFASSL